jgi:hypothetical protein
MLATQRGGEPARHESVHNLYALDVARGCHDLKERSVERERALELCEVGNARLREKLRLLPTRTLGVSSVHPIDVFHDREAGRSERVGEQKRTRVSAVIWDA